MNTVYILKNVCKGMFILLLCSPFLLPGAVNHKWEIKLNAGTTYSDLNRFNNTMENLGWNMRGGRWDDVHWGIDASVEIEYRLNKKYGISVGAGFFQFKQNTNGGISFGADYEIFKFDTRIQAVPITLNFLYTIPMGEKFRFKFSAGPGLYLSRLSIKNYLSLIDGLHLGEIKTHGPAMGGQAAIGLEMDLGSRFALTLEMNGRMARFNDVMKNVETWIDGSKSGLYIDLPDYVDLSGLGLRLGVKMFL
ncbi:MAG: outer membrane beta-barrel protein [Acidobacteria bacterium]|nr:outer membrane beta-barrel protein [Acidobacteriota bacterium]